MVVIGQIRKFGTLELSSNILGFLLQRCSLSIFLIQNCQRLRQFSFDPGGISFIAFRGLADLAQRLSVAQSLAISRLGLFVSRIGHDGDRRRERGTHIALRILPSLISVHANL